MSYWNLDKRRCLQYCRHFLVDNSVFHVERCMSVMQSGTQMVKLKNGAKGLVRLFYLDEHRTCIRWRPSRKSEKAKIIIDSIYKVTEGRQSEIFHRHAEGNFDPSCCFTIYHGNHMESLDLITSNPEEARTWITGLKYLMAGISDEDSLVKRQRTHDQYPSTDKNGDGLLNIEEIHQLMHKLNVNLPRRKVRQMFQEADTDENQGTLTFEEFSVFYKMMSLRRDLYLLLLSYSDKKDHLTVEEFAQFLKVEQKMSNVTTEYCLDIMRKFEVSEENKNQNVLGIEGFTNFMRSPACDVFNALHSEVHQDMDQPLCNYFIASSHNTYLTGDQLLSQSKVEMYARVLQDGCRCLEVDCWDGPDGEPVVHHGYTLTSKILFKDVLEVINKNAFVKNEFPIILSIENHCSIQQQKKIAQYLKEIFSDKLDLTSVNAGDSKQLPSPQSLKGKILIKGKKLPHSLGADAEEGEVSDEDSADEIEDDCKLKFSYSNGTTEHQIESFIRKKLESLLKESQIRDKEDPDCFTVRALLKATHEGLNVNFKQNSDQKDTNKKSHGRLMSNFGKHKLCRDLSDLVVYTNSVAAQDIVDDGSAGNVLSFSETRAHQVVQQKAEQFMLYNQKQLTRIYPSAYRIDSSNFNPLPYWNVGCQLVALNYQSDGRVMQLNQAKFKMNGNCGYVLKPQQMCKGTFSPCSADPLPAFPKKQLILKIISGQQLPKPPDSMLGDRGEIIDPFVEVEIIGLPADCCKDQTRVVDDNGFNPVWEETLSFTIHMPEIALVRFLVWDHDPIGRDFVGQRTVAFSSLMPGYRHVYLDGLTEASVFVHITINEIFGKNKQLIGLRGLFNKNPKHNTVENGCLYVRKRSIGERILRRTASAPAKGRKKSKMGFQEATELKESVSEVTDLKDKDGVLRRTSRSLQARPISMPVEKYLLRGLPSPDQKATTTMDDKKEKASELKRGTVHLHSHFRDTLSGLFECLGKIMARSGWPSETILKEPESEENKDLCSVDQKLWEGAEKHKTEASSSVPKEHKETMIKSHTLVNSTITNLSLDDSFSSACHDVQGFHYTPAIQDTDISHLISEVSLTDESDLSSSVSALIDQADVTSGQTNLTIVSSPPEVDKKIFNVKSTHSPHMAPLSPTSSLHVSADKLDNENTTRCVEEPSTVSSCISSVTQLKSDPKRKCRTNWESFSDSNSCFSDASDLERTIFAQFPPANSAGNLLITTYEYKREDMSQLASPLRLKHNQDTLYHSKAICEHPYSVDIHSANQVEDGKFKNEKTQYFPYSKHQNGDILYNNYFQFSNTQNEVLNISQTANVSKNALPLPSFPAQKQPSPCKSKSLGDLTSEDISCNFESKYKYISRGFITSGMKDKMVATLKAKKPQTTDSLTEQLRKLVSFDQDDSCQSFCSQQNDDCPKMLVRKLSSRSQSRVRNIASRAKERQEASKQKLSNTSSNVAGVVFRNKPSMTPHVINRHSTGSYIASYLENFNADDVESRGVPEGACTSLRFGYSDRFCTDDSLLETKPNEDDKPEIYFLLRL
uniref:Phosphoinositide phospholipase C n=1 Tax=Anolis carolinensis TaxID=28377 RepID=A0A803SM73_ANOCA